MILSELLLHSHFQWMHDCLMKQNHRYIVYKQYILMESCAHDALNKTDSHRKMLFARLSRYYFYANSLVIRQILRKRISSSPYWFVSSVFLLKAHFFSLFQLCQIYRECSNNEIQSRDLFFLSSFSVVWVNKMRYGEMSSKKCDRAFEKCSNECDHDCQIKCGE